MEVFRSNGVEDIAAICGGCCSCGTCHVYVEQPGVDRLDEMAEDENDVLDGSLHRQENSRLSCQIPWSDELNGLRVRVAPAD